MVFIVIALRPHGMSFFRYSSILVSHGCHHACLVTRSSGTFTTELPASRRPEVCFLSPLPTSETAGPFKFDKTCRCAPASLDFRQVRRHTDFCVSRGDCGQRADRTSDYCQCHEASHASPASLISMFWLWASRSCR